MAVQKQKSPFLDIRKASTLVSTHSVIKVSRLVPKGIDDCDTCDFCKDGGLGVYCWMFNQPLKHVGKKVEVFGTVLEEPRYRKCKECIQNIKLTKENG